MLIPAAWSRRGSEAGSLLAGAASDIHNHDSHSPVLIVRVSAIHPVIATDPMVRETGMVILVMNPNV